MPVIQLSIERLRAYCKYKASEKAILETLPYLGLDIEDQEGDRVSVEYSPNRPDFSSEAGIARSLVGLLEIETGPPKYAFQKGEFVITVSGKEISRVRPIIRALSAEIDVTDELIKQLIAMQEDLHNGIGRRRSRVAIGIHNAAVISSSIKYYALKDSNFSFVPLGSSKRETIKQILSETGQGKAYGKLLSGHYPMLEDSNGNVLSMPPVINGDLTKLMPGVSKLFVDVTGTDDTSVEVSTAIIAAMLSDIGARVFQVNVTANDGSVWAPDMMDRKSQFDLKLTNEILGLQFSLDEARVSLEKSRLGLDSDGNALIPRYRGDIIHPIDLAEEVALGYGIWKIKPAILSSSSSGSLNGRMKKIDSVVEVLVGLGMTEIWNLSLSPADVVQFAPGEALQVEDPKSLNFEFLRSELLPSLLQGLSSSIHEEYPQLIFEEAPIFSRSAETGSGVKEEEHVAALIADSRNAKYSDIRSKLDAFLRLVSPPNAVITFKPEIQDTTILAKGRSASIILGKGTDAHVIGKVGEVAPSVLEKFGILVPVSGFELNLEPLLLKG